MCKKIAISSVEFLSLPLGEYLKKIKAFNAESLKKFLEIVKKFNVKYVELWTPEFVDNEKVTEAEEILDSFGIKAPCVTSWMPMAPLETAKENKKKLLSTIDIAEKIGSDYVLIYGGPYKAVGFERATENFIKNIIPCVEYAEERDVTILVENEFGDDLMRRADWCLRVLQHFKSEYLKLNYDPCNFYIASEEPYPYAFEMLKDFIAYIHVKDAKKVEAGKGVFKDNGKEYACVPLGKGGVNYEGLLGGLKKIRYDNFLTNEPHIDFTMPPETRREKLLETLKLSISYLNKKLV